MITARGLKDIIRVNQWYKNSIIFLAIIFAPKFISIENVFLITLGFVALCLVSSANYIRNDIVDIELDKIHPDKKKRPLPAGLLTVKNADILFVIFAVSGLALSFSLDLKFGILAVLLFLITEAYSRWLKKIILVDVFTIGCNFIIRAISGIVLIKSPFSPWIIMGVFFVALLLAFIKRRGELELLYEVGGRHRKTLEEYNPSSLNSMVVMSAMSVIITYSFYSLAGPYNDWRLVLTVPIVVFVILRQVHLSSINDPLIRKNTNMLKDKHTIIAVGVYLLWTIYLIYFTPSSYFAKII